MAKDELTLDDIDDEAVDAPSQLRQFAERAGAKAAKVPGAKRGRPKKAAQPNVGPTANAVQATFWIRGPTKRCADNDEEMAR